MGRISALKNKIGKLQIKIISLGTSLSAEYVAALDKEIMELKKEGQCKQITIDGLEFEVSKREKRIKNEDQIIISLGKEIALLKQKVNCREEDIVTLINKLHRANKHLADANKNIDILNAIIKIDEDKKIKNKIKKLFAS